ncbi:MAG: hypothetical protein AAFV93_04225 [Chloroflexota bacterium]
MPYSPMELAEVFLKTGELDDALEALQEQLTQEPDDDVARQLYIQVKMRLAKASELANLVQEFDRLNELTIDDYQLQSVIFERTNQLDHAIDVIRVAHQLDPENPRLIERLLDLYLANQAYDEALELVRQQARTWQWLEREGDILVLLGNDILATARYGLVLAHLDDLTGTIREDYLQALRLRVILARAHAYRRLEHTAPAREHYQLAQSIVKDDVTIQFNLGLLDFLDGDTESAIQQCQTALEQASDVHRQNMISSLDDTETFAPLKVELNL